SRRPFRCRPLVDYIVRVSLLSSRVGQVQRDRGRVGGGDVSDVVAFPDGSGDPGRRRDQFSNEEKIARRADPVPRIRKQRLTHPPTSMTAPADTSRDVSNLMLVEARSTIPGGRSREGFCLLVCLRLELFRLDGYYLRTSSREFDGKIGITRVLAAHNRQCWGLCPPFN